MVMAPLEAGVQLLHARMAGCTRRLTTSCVDYCVALLHMTCHFSCCILSHKQTSYLLANTSWDPTRKGILLTVWVS